MSKFLDSFAGHVNEDVGFRTKPMGEPGISENDGRLRLKNAAQIEVDRIVADTQHREQFDEDSIDRLAASIKDHKQLQPIRVRWDGGRQQYVIIAGERRWRAVKRAGLTHIDCLVVDEELTPDQILTQQILENCQREDLKPLERAKAFRDLMQQRGWDGKRLAAELHISEGTVSNALKLLTLDEETQQKVTAGEIPATAAVQQARQARTGRQRGQCRAKPYQTSLHGGPGVTIEVRFRKSAVEPHEIVAALKHALAELEGSQAKAA